MITRTIPRRYSIPSRPSTAKVSLSRPHQMTHRLAPLRQHLCELQNRSQHRGTSQRGPSCTVCMRAMRRGRLTNTIPASKQIDLSTSKVERRRLKPVPLGSRTEEEEPERADEDVLLLRPREELAVVSVMRHDAAVYQTHELT